MHGTHGPHQDGADSMSLIQAQGASKKGSREDVGKQGLETRILSQFGSRDSRNTQQSTQEDPNISYMSWVPWVSWGLDGRCASNIVSASILDQIGSMEVHCHMMSEQCVGGNQPSERSNIQHTSAATVLTSEHTLSNIFTAV